MWQCFLIGAKLRSQFMYQHFLLSLLNFALKHFFIPFVSVHVEILFHETPPKIALSMIFLLFVSQNQAQVVSVNFSRVQFADFEIVFEFRNLLFLLFLRSVYLRHFRQILGANCHSNLFASGFWKSLPTCRQTKPTPPLDRHFLSAKSH